MAWKWYEISSYKLSVGGASYYGIVQLSGTGFYSAITFCKNGPLPNSYPSTTYGQRFYGFLDFQQMAQFVDILRNEKPIRFGWDDANPNNFQIMTGDEPVGEGDGILAST